MKICLLAEGVEQAALESHHEAASGETRERLGLHLETIGTARLSIAAACPSSVINRTIGLGLAAPDVRESVEAIVARYAERGVESYYLHLHPEARPPELRDWILAAGLERRRAWVKFHRGKAAPLPETRSELTARRIGAERAGDFARIAAAAFGLPESARSLLAGLVDHPAWRIYLSFDGDTPAGAAALFIHEGVGWLDWAATLPEFRRRGSQSALMRRRIEDALDSGCRFLLTETGEAVGGDPQHSYRNILRAGFEPLHLRENFGPAP
jgi:GNAT superfamily N-acetyltransferase